MKKHIYLLAGVLLIVSCAKNTDVTPVRTPAATIKDAGAIKFKISPLSNTEVKVSFVNDQKNKLSRIILKADTNTLQTQLIEEIETGVFSATIKYNFEPGKKYNFQVQTTAVSNTINQYQIPEYVHNYVSQYAYQKILPLHQNLGYNAFDISPSHNSLFITDYVNNVSQIKKIDLQSLSVENISSTLIGTLIRAVSDNELLICGDKSTENVPATPDPGQDAVILARYNINTRKSVFVDYVSDGYGRTSRVVNNHVLVTNPVYTAKTASLIDLGDLSKVKYPLTTIDFTGINQSIFGHIMYNNMLVNVNSGQMSSPLSLNTGSGIAAIDDASGYTTVVSSIRTDEKNDILSGFSFYKDKAQVYQSEYSRIRIPYFPIITNITNDIIVFYQSFGYDTNVNIDGYYALNLKTKEIKLVQSDSSNLYVVLDYQLKDGSMISVRIDGVYKLTPR